MILNSAQHPYRASFRVLLFQWQRQISLWILAVSILVTTGFYLKRYFALEESLRDTNFHFVFDLTFPAFPLAVFGGALGIFISFRTNSAYQRWWEGRKLWGRMINTSRHITSQAVAYLPEKEAQQLVHRHIAYVHALRCALRDQDPQQDEHFCRALTEEQRASLVGSTNVNHALLNAQFKQLVPLAKDGTITDFFMSDFDESIRHLLDIQGGTERIKKTPFPPIYGHLGERMTQLYAVIFPLCLVSSLGWLTIPISFLVCITFQLINEVGRTLENPFTTFWPALPLSAMSLTIERNLRQALGEDELPDGEAPQKSGSIHVLM